MNFAICAGHGGSAPGAVAFSRTERELMTEFRDILAAKLRARQHTVATDGGTGVNLPLADALKLVKNADAALEFHLNAGIATAKGVETLSLPRQKKLSQRISKAIADVLGSPLRGDGGWRPQEESARGQLAFVNAGGLIVEICFISNALELETYLRKKELVAEAVAEELSKGL